MPDAPHTYVRIIHRGRGFNVRVLLPNGDDTLVSRNELENWVQVPLNPDAPEYVCTRRRNRERNQNNNQDNNSDGDQNQENNQDDTERVYVAVLERRRGRGNNIRLLLPDGHTISIPSSELRNWTCVAGNNQVVENREFAENNNENRTRSENPVSRRYRHPVNQADRIYIRILHRGSRNTSLELENNCMVRVPNEFLPEWLRKDSIEYNRWKNSITVRTIDDITFGVELEFIADSYRYNEFISTMRNTLGSRFNNPMCYHVHSTTQWLLKTDASVQNRNRNTPSYRGYELTSPILKLNDESKNELSKVLNIITSVFKGTVNVTCGTHIHIGNYTCIPRGGDSFNEFANKCRYFQLNYGKWERSVFDRLTSPSRRGNSNRYCLSCERSTRGFCTSDRYYKMNILNATDCDGFGTLENRQHNGTLELKKIWYWVELNSRYILEYFKNPDKFSYSPYETNDLVTFFEKINLSHEAQTFFFARESELN